MAFFKKKNKKYDLSDVLDNNDFIMDLGESFQQAECETKIKPAHALTAREILTGNETAVEELPMQHGIRAADALRERMQRQPTAPAAEIPMKPELKPQPAPPKTVPEQESDFEQLISRLHALVRDTGSTKEDAADSEFLAQNDITDIISVAERRAEQRAQAAYNRHATPPEQEYPFYNPLSESDTPKAPADKDSDSLNAILSDIPKPEETPEPIPAAPLSAAESPVAPPQMHLATETPDVAPKLEELDLNATQPFDISGEVSRAIEPDPYGTREYDAIQPSIETETVSGTNMVLDTNKEDVPPEEEGEAEEYPDDYTCIDDAPQKKLQLSRSIKKLGWRTAICAISTLLFLLLSGALFVNLQLPDFTRNLLQLGLLLICALAGSNILRGILSVFKGVSDVDSVAAVALLFTIAHNLYFGFASKTAPILQPEAAIALSLTLFNYGKLMNVRRVYKNFCRIATSSEKHAVHFIENEAAVNSIVRGALDGPALICTGRRTVNLNGFFKNTYSRDVQSSISDRLLVIAGVAALLIGVLGFTQISAEFAFTAVTLTLSFFAAPASVLVTVMPLKAAADALEEYNTVLPGYSSAFKIRSANAIAVDVADLFPKGNVKLYNMHTLSKNPVDRSLCEAAAVVMAARSPLSDIFAQITGSLKENLPAVDSMLYEERLGLSGWVDDRRILIGNRTLMENHNVQIPSYDVDKKILSKGFFPVYIAADSKPCVLLVIGYTADDSITYELRRLCNAGYTVMVNSCDPNTSSDMLCDYFGLPDGSVKTMNADGVRAYKEEINYQESLESVACYDQSVCGLFALATASMRVPSLSVLMVVLNILSIAVGVAALGCIIFMGTTTLLSALTVLIYQLISTLIISLMPALFRP